MFVRNLAFSKNLAQHILARPGFLDLLYQKAVISSEVLTSDKVKTAMQATSILWILVSHSEKASTKSFSDTVSHLCASDQGSREEDEGLGYSSQSPGIFST